MGVELVCKNELSVALNDTRFLKVQYGNSDKVDVCRVFLTTRDTIDVLVNAKSLNSDIFNGMDVVCKFEYGGFEYAIDGSIIDICEIAPVTVTIKILEIKKVVNRRKHIRYESNIKAVLNKINGSRQTECVVKNISKGGAAIVCNRGDLDKGKSEVILQITIDNSALNIRAKVIRKNEISNEKQCLQKQYGYGLQFEDVTHEQNYQLDEIIRDIVIGYEQLLSSTSPLAHGKTGEYAHINSKVVFVDSDDDITQLERYVKKLATDISVLQNISFLMDFLAKDKPNIVIINLSNSDRSVTETIVSAVEIYSNIQFCLVIGFDNTDVMLSFEGKQNVEFLYKPFIYSEIEEKLVKYL